MLNDVLSSDATVADVLNGYTAAKKAKENLIDSYVYLMNTIPMDSSMESNLKYLIAKVDRRVEAFERLLRLYRIVSKN